MVVVRGKVGTSSMITVACSTPRVAFFNKINLTEYMFQHQTGPVLTELHRFESMTDPIGNSNRPFHRFPVGSVQPSGL